MSNFSLSRLFDLIEDDCQDCHLLASQIPSADAHPPAYRCGCELLHDHLRYRHPHRLRTNDDGAHEAPHDMESEFFSPEKTLSGSRQQRQPLMDFAEVGRLQVGIAPGHVEAAVPELLLQMKDAAPWRK